MEKAHVKFIIYKTLNFLLTNFTKLILWEKQF